MQPARIGPARIGTASVRAILRMAKPPRLAGLAGRRREKVKPFGLRPPPRSGLEAERQAASLVAVFLTRLLAGGQVRANGDDPRRVMSAFSISMSWTGTQSYHSRPGLLFRSFAFLHELLPSGTTDPRGGAVGHEIAGPVIRWRRSSSISASRSAGTWSRQWAGASSCRTPP